MSERQHALDPALAARLPDRVRIYLVKHLPFGKDYEHNLGMLIGLQCARVLLDATQDTPALAREVVSEAIKATAARLDRQLAEQQPELHAKWQGAQLTHEQ